MNDGKDYTHRSWLAVAALIAVLAGVSLVPPYSVGGVSLRRANILSDLIDFGDRETRVPTSQVALDEEEFHIDLEKVAKQVAQTAQPEPAEIAADTLPAPVQTTFEWTIAPADTTLRPVCADSIRLRGTIQPLEDFDTTGCSPLQILYEKLLDGRPVRIAVMGDSFIEGDILTADLREALQQTYGGSGTGFAPMASPLTGFRRTVRTSAKGWTPYNIMQYKTTPQPLRNDFYVSGWLCRPENGAQTRWEGTDARRRLDPCEGARILFLSRGDSRVEVSLNDTLHRTFEVGGAEGLRQIAVSGGPIHSLTFRVADGAAGVIGYGALLGTAGVGVDNYSVRSNNGQAMFRTNPALNAQAGSMIGYDLVVLQYGLNIMQQGIRNYANYGAQIVKMIAYIRECFPSAAVLVMGVSDRSVRTDKGFEPMDAIPYMAACQREAAQTQGAAFWDTAAAMGAMGGMAQFVANGWAGKDYTHINFAGGRQVALALADAIHDGVRRTAQEREERRLREERSRCVADSLRQAMHERLMAPAVIK